MKLFVILSLLCAPAHATMLSNISDVDSLLQRASTAPQQGVLTSPPFGVFDYLPANMVEEEYKPRPLSTEDFIFNLYKYACNNEGNIRNIIGFITDFTPTIIEAIAGGHVKLFCEYLDQEGYKLASALLKLTFRILTFSFSDAIFSGDHGKLTEMWESINEMGEALVHHMDPQVRTMLLGDPATKYRFIDLRNVLWEAELELLEECFDFNWDYKCLDKMQAKEETPKHVKYTEGGMFKKHMDGAYPTMELRCLPGGGFFRSDTWQWKRKSHLECHPKCWYDGGPGSVPKAHAEQTWGRHPTDDYSTLLKEAQKRKHDLDPSMDKSFENSCDDPDADDDSYGFCDADREWRWYADMDPKTPVYCCSDFERFTHQRSEKSMMFSPKVLWTPHPMWNQLFQGDTTCGTDERPKDPAFWICCPDAASKLGLKPEYD